MSLGYSSISHSNQILQPNIAGGANPSGGHFVNPGPQYSSIVGGVSGCPGAGCSAAALARNPGYNIVAKQSGGNYLSPRVGYKHGKSKKHCKSKRRRCRKSNKRQRGGNVRPLTLGGACHCKRSNKRQRGGGELTPASFSGANPTYHQYMGNIPASNNFSVGGSLSPTMSGMANPAPITVFPNCPTK